MSAIPLHELVADEAARRREFPVCATKVFLAHAAVCPLPHCVSAAMQQHLAAATRDNQEDFVPDGLVHEARQLTAQLIEATPEEIAFVGSTSMGLAMVATGLAWQPGDNVVCYRDDYPANVYPWLDLARRGVEVRYVVPRQFGNVTVEDIAPLVDARTRLVALASVHFQSGWRLDVERMGRFLRERGVLFCLDGIQSFGALRTSMRWVDFAAADAHKWLLGPLGTAILFVRREHFEKLHPALVGWHSARCPDFVAQDRLGFWPDARRYEPGSLNLAGIVGLHAALQSIFGWGIENIEDRVLSLARRIIQQAAAHGLQVVGPANGVGLSGIVSLADARRDLVGVHARLMDCGIGTSLRRLRDGSACLRISAHAYNTAADLDRLFEQW